MARVYNFSPGPSMLPEPVLRKAASELVEFGSTGQSVMEMSHRSKEYGEIITGCEEVLRELMKIPDSYEVLFLQGGASTQFAMVPLNLMTGSGSADYMVTGSWAKKAAAEGGRFGEARVVASSEAQTFSTIPELDPAACNPTADYFHICYNNTIYGTKFPAPPKVAVPLVADMSSCILSEPVHVEDFALIYAGAQKNMGPAGVTVVILRKDLIGRAKPETPIMLNYATHAKEHSMYNTPPTYAIYLCGLVFRWLRDEIGGLAAMQAVNEKKAGLLYDYLDHSQLFRPTADRRYRSLMNIPFVIGDDDKEKQFIAEAQKAGFINLKGHRSVGGMRASLYNAMPVEGVEKLIDFMRRFEAANR